MVKIGTEVQGGAQLARKVRRMPAELRERVAEAAEKNALDFAYRTRIAAHSVRVSRSISAAPLPASANTAWQVVGGGDEAWFIHLEEAGTRPGLREHRRGARKGLQFDHPGTGATGFWHGTYRLQRNTYRGNFIRAYRGAGKAIAASGGSTNINLTGRRLTDFYG